MLKLVTLVVFFVAAVPSFAQECASDVQSLRALVENKGLATVWKENTNKNPYTLTIADGGGALLLKVRSQKGEIASAHGVICERGDNFAARLKEIKWGAEAPGLAKATSFKEIKIKFIYDSVMKVSISIFGFEFMAAK